MNSSTTEADPPTRPAEPTTSARAAEPPQRSGPGANPSGFDSSRDYFPVARQSTATRPAHDAPTFAQAVAVVALGRAA